MTFFTRISNVFFQTDPQSKIRNALITSHPSNHCTRGYPRENLHLPYFLQVYHHWLYW